MYTIVTQCKQLTCKAGAAASSPPPPPPSPTSPSLSHHEPLKGEQNLTAGAALTYSPPIAPPSYICCPRSHHRLPSLKNLSPHYPYLFLPLLLSGGRASNAATQVLVSAAPFSPAVTLSLSPRCPSATLTTRLFVSIKP